MLSAGIRRHRFGMEEYHRMGEVGIFSEGDCGEHLEGEIVRTLRSKVISLK